ncbi:MAG: response regulator, partial [Blautia sp.]|nr:response regulator [Blautia sp.]
MEKRYRVLVVDDEYWSRESLRGLLPWKDYGLEMLEPACDGEEVLSRMDTEKPDIILTDIDMPFMDGLELMGRLGESYPDVICIAVSGYDDFDKVKGFFRQGGNDYLLKPVEKEELIKVLTSALATLEKRQQEMEDKREQQGRLSSLMEDSEYSALLNEQLYGGQGTGHQVREGFLSDSSVLLVKFHDVFRLSTDYGHDMGHLSELLKGKIRSLLPLSEMEKPPILFNYAAKMSEFILAGSFPAGWLLKAPALFDEGFPL